MAPHALGGGALLAFVSAIAINTLTWLEDERSIYGTSHREVKERETVGAGGGKPGGTTRPMP